LYLVKKVHEKSKSYLGITKLQKLVFLAEKTLNEKGIKAFTYDFFVWDYGSLSKEIYLDHERLVENDIINQDENIALSKRGKKFVEDVKEIFEKNRDILENIDSIIGQFADFGTASLVEYVHDLKIRIKGHKQPLKISDLNKGTDIISKIKEKDAEKTFEIDEPWIETVEILLDKEFYRAIKEAEMDAIEGRILQLNEVL
jgi:hypothetical protein